MLLAAYERAAQVLESQGARIAWLTTPCFAPAPWEGRTFDYADWKIGHINDLYESFVATETRTTLIDYRPSVCPDDQYAQKVDGVTVRPDDGIHYTPAGADVVARWVLPHLVALTG